MNCCPTALTIVVVLCLSTLAGCGPEEYNTQRFDEGAATCLSGKRLYFSEPFLTEKSAPLPHYDRFVSNQAVLSVDPTTHEIIDFSQGDPFAWTLPTGLEVAYYHQRFDTLFIDSDGTIAFGSPGTGNDTLIDAFSSDQLSLLPVDATIEGAIVRYAADSEKIVITYENIAGSTFQCEFFLEGEQQYEIAITYPVVSDATRAGVVGLPDRLHQFLTANDNVEAFLTQSFMESNLCEDSPLN